MSAATRVPRPAEARLVMHRTLAGYRSWRQLCLSEGLDHNSLWRLLHDGRAVGDEFVTKLARLLNVPPSTLRQMAAAMAAERAEHKEPAQ